MSDMPWHTYILLRMESSNRAAISMPGSMLGMSVSVAPLDGECLGLIIPGTPILAQVLKGVLHDWTLAPGKDYKPPQLPGDQWKDA